MTQLETQLYEALKLASEWINIPEVDAAIAEYERQRDEANREKVYY